MYTWLIVQFLLEELTQCSVLPLQIKHSHFQLYALLPKILKQAREHTRLIKKMKDGNSFKQTRVALNNAQHISGPL